MTEIELSLITEPNDSDTYPRMLQDFERQTGIHVKLTKMGWGDAWSNLVKVGLYHTGPDVSEIGSTWLSSLVGMNVLRPFVPAEIDSMGGEKVFIPASLESTKIFGDTQTYSMPFLTDTRLVFYRRDLFAQAGIDETQAFSSPEKFEAALAALKQAGIDTPLAIPTRKSRMTLHNASSWVWGNGGHLLSEDGKSCSFQEPAALRGWEQYFCLGRLLPPDLQHLDDTASDALYWSGRTAVSISGPWVLKTPFASSGVLANTGIAFPPGVPFIGGSNLVVWNHTRRPREAIMLVRYLTSQATQASYLQGVGLLPVNQQVFNDPPYSTDLRYQRMKEELQLGRSFRLIPLWGLVEDRLTSTLAMVWDTLMENPGKEVSDVLEDHLKYLAQQLDNTLKSR